MIYLEQGCKTRTGQVWRFQFFFNLWYNIYVKRCLTCKGDKAMIDNLVEYEEIQIVWFTNGAKAAFTEFDILML